MLLYYGRQHQFQGACVVLLGNAVLQFGGTCAQEVHCSLILFFAGFLMTVCVRILPALAANSSDGGRHLPGVIHARGSCLSMGEKSRHRAAAAGQLVFEVRPRVQLNTPEQGAGWLARAGWRGHLVSSLSRSSLSSSTQLQQQQQTPCGLTF
jgi:hypothetical protein